MILYYTITRHSIRIFQSFQNAHSESLEARECNVLFVSAIFLLKQHTHVSPLFEIKNSILSVARYTRGIVYLVTQATRPANLVTVRQRALRNHDFLGFPGASAFNSTVPLLHYLQALTTSRLKF